ncbi:hypothetical protein EDB85DRAFT_1890392 [Lactarius pseudohatsudake]|nr:hypothetical protein EDB85DRAFT_1890392 [Lactarius pseudohatsudake]
MQWTGRNRGGKQGVVWCMSLVMLGLEHYRNIQRQKGKRDIILLNMVQVLHQGSLLDLQPWDLSLGLLEAKGVWGVLEGKAEEVLDDRVLGAKAIGIAGEPLLWPGALGSGPGDTRGEDGWDVTRDTRPNPGRLPDWGELPMLRFLTVLQNLKTELLVFDCEALLGNDVYPRESASRAGDWLSVECGIKEFIDEGKVEDLIRGAEDRSIRLIWSLLMTNPMVFFVNTKMGQGSLTSPQEVLEV